MLHIVLALTLVLLNHSDVVASQTVQPGALASQYSLTTSTSMPFPTATLTSNDSQKLIKSSWGVSKGRIQNGGADLAFVSDPFPNSPAPGTTAPPGPVLEVTYPQGSYSHDTGGSQFESLWNTTDGSAFDSMILTYEIAFDSGFNWVMGGKLPGLRGGPEIDSCSGGDAANGTNCFSSRLMWRKNGTGEGKFFQRAIFDHILICSSVYAYIPASDTLCSNSNFMCNQDGFGTSIDRGSFTFLAGQ